MYSENGWHMVKKTSYMIQLMEKKSCTTWDVKNSVTNGMNYQPQLVKAGFLNHHQQYAFQQTGCRILDPNL